MGIMKIRLKWWIFLDSCGRVVSDISAPQKNNLSINHSPGISARRRNPEVAISYVINLFGLLSVRIRQNLCPNFPKPRWPLSRSLLGIFPSWFFLRAGVAAEESNWTKSKINSASLGNLRKVEDATSAREEPAGKGVRWRWAEDVETKGADERRRIRDRENPELYFSRCIPDWTRNPTR